MPTMRPRSGHATLADGHAWDMSSPTVAGARIRRFLEEEPVVWLSTVRPDGAPHIVPIWFWWDGGALVVASKPGAQKVRNLRANPSVMLALGDAEDDFDVGLLKGRAELLDRPSRETLPAGLFAKYAARLSAMGVDAAEFAATYSQVIRIVPGHVPRLARPVDAAERARGRGARHLHRRAPPRRRTVSRSRAAASRSSRASSSRHAAGCRCGTGSARRCCPGSAGRPRLTV